MRWVDPTIGVGRLRLVASRICRPMVQVGISRSSISAIDEVDFISLHHYFATTPIRHPPNIRPVVELTWTHFIKEGRRRSPTRSAPSALDTRSGSCCRFDEWNVWYKASKPDKNLREARLAGSAEADRGSLQSRGRADGRRLPDRHA
jgi:hypothetical protein